MTYYKDFSPCDYFKSNNWLCRLIAVGWLEKQKPYATGEVNPSIIEKLRELRQDFGKAFPRIKFRGLHQCSLCNHAGEPDSHLEDSHINLFIPHQGFVFVAPGRIDHYIEQHHYLPPESFIDSVLQCPSPLIIDFRVKIRESNRGFDAPLFDK